MQLEGKVDEWANHIQDRSAIINYGLFGKSIEINLFIKSYLTIFLLTFGCLG